MTHNNLVGAFLLTVQVIELLLEALLGLPVLFAVVSELFFDEETWNMDHGLWPRRALR
jgi:hypothetical protein